MRKSYVGLGTKLLCKVLVQSPGTERWRGGGEQKFFVESSAALIKSYARSCAASGGQKLIVPPQIHSADGFIMVFVAAARQSLVRSLSTAKIEMGTQGLSNTEALYQDVPKTCAKIFGCGKSLYGSCAPGGVPRRSLTQVL